MAQALNALAGLPCARAKRSVLVDRSKLIAIYSGVASTRSIRRRVIRWRDEAVSRGRMRRVPAAICHIHGPVVIEREPTDLLVVGELGRQAFAKITELKQQGRAR